MSNADVRKLKEKRNTPEGNLDTNGNPLRFSRDRESDWTIKNDTPHYGLKEHTSVDVQSGFVLAKTLTPASEHDSKYLPYLTIASCHTKDPIETVYGDKGYYGHPNRAFLHMNGIKDGIMRKDTTTAKLTELEIQRNKSISKKRYIVEQYFGLSHLHDGAYRARFTTILKNIGVRCAGRWHSICFGVLSYWHIHNDNKEACPKAKRGHTETRNSPSRLIKGVIRRRKSQE